MDIRSILCIFNGQEAEDNTVNIAFLLAKLFSADIRFLYIAPQFPFYPSMYEEAITSSTIISDLESQERQKLYDQAHQDILYFANKHNVPLDKHDELHHHPFARFIGSDSDEYGVIKSEGAASDIIIIGRNVSYGKFSGHDAIITALFNTGRQLLLLPPGYNMWEDKVVSIAWNGSLESARAIFNAMPILERAERIYLLTAGKNGDIATIQAHNPMVEYMHAHNLQPCHIMIDAEKHLEAKAILEKSRELGTNLLVMGAYGHNRFLEIIMGGFTRYMLDKADIPVLFSH